MGMKYSKHNLYAGNYEVSGQGVCHPPTESEWTVLDHVGEHDEGGSIHRSRGKGRIHLLDSSRP